MAPAPRLRADLRSIAALQFTIRLSTAGAFAPRPARATDAQKKHDGPAPYIAGIATLYAALCVCLASQASLIGA